jgi:hypothetical protein
MNCIKAFGVMYGSRDAAVRAVGGPGAFSGAVIPAGERTLENSPISCHNRQLM